MQTIQLKNAVTVFTPLIEEQQVLSMGIEELEKIAGVHHYIFVFSGPWGGEGWVAHLSAH
jgi:hypothetical protein